MPTEPWSREEFERRLRAKESDYHVHHPFHIMMNEGKLTPAQIRGWVANRFYYQFSIPMKDGAVLSNCPDREVRRLWIQRILDQDGTGGEAGGIESWIRLGEAVGIDRAELTSLRLVLPAVRFAVDAYVNFARTRPWQEAACSSLTEMFAPQAHNDRLATWPSPRPRPTASRRLAPGSRPERPHRRPAGASGRPGRRTRTAPHPPAGR